MLLGDVLILGSRKAPGVEAGLFGYRSVKLDFQVRVVHFQEGYAEFSVNFP